MDCVVANSGNPHRRGAPLHAAKTVLWAFFGVRRGRDQAAMRLTPRQIIVAAVIGAALFVLAIVSVVQLLSR